jgi:hypothetical protein
VSLALSTKEDLFVARITLRQLLDHAAEYSYGVPAFNINNMEQGLAILEAASATRSPVILQASRGARAYANDIVLAKLIDALSKCIRTFRSACISTTATTKPPARPPCSTASPPS